MTEMRDTDAPATAVTDAAVGDAPEAAMDAAVGAVTDAAVGEPLGNCHSLGRETFPSYLTRVGAVSHRS